MGFPKKQAQEEWSMRELIEHTEGINRLLARFQE